MQCTNCQGQKGNDEDLASDHRLAGRHDHHDRDDRLEFADLADALHWARRSVDDAATGVVLVQGTDTLEETSYLLDLHWDRPEPLVVTGAMRPPQQPSADGPANLLAALLAAAAPESRGLGVLAVLNDEVHAASRIHEGAVVYANRVARPRPLPGPVPVHAPKVALLEASLGDTGELLALASEADFDGIVLSAFGAGHVPSAMATMVSKAAERVPIVLASRAGAGSVLEGTYGFTGSERDLLDRGAVSAGWLDARKARILLSCLLAADEPIDRIRAEFALRNGRIFGSNT
jgi:L-asparaginase